MAPLGAPRNFWMPFRLSDYFLLNSRGVRKCFTMISKVWSARNLLMCTLQPAYITLYMPVGNLKFLKFSKNVIYAERYKIIWRSIPVSETKFLFFGRASWIKCEKVFFSGESKSEWKKNKIAIHKNPTDTSQQSN